MVIDLKSSKYLQKSRIQKRGNELKTNLYSNFKIWLVLLNCLLLGIITLAPIWGDGVDSLYQTNNFILGLSLLLLTYVMMWILGFIKQYVFINILDIAVFILGFIIIIVSLFHANQLAWWGSTLRFFDSGFFIAFLILFYILSKLVLDIKSINFLILFFAFVVFIKSILYFIESYSQILIDFIPNLNLFFSNKILTIESPNEIAFISLLCLNIIFLNLIKTNKFQYILLSFIYYIYLFVHIMLILKVDSYAIYTLTIVLLIMHARLQINQIFKSKLNKNKKMYLGSVFLMTSLISVFLILVMFLNPFSNINAMKSDSESSSVPSLQNSIQVSKASLQNYTWSGSGSVLYAWNKFVDVPNNQLQNIDFTTDSLSSEFLNIITRYGALVAFMIIFIVVWVLVSFIRIIIVQKVVPLFIYPTVIILIGIFFIPYGVFLKIFLVLLLVYWSNIFSQYFHPISKINLDMRAIHVGNIMIISFFLFIIMSVSIWGSISAINIMRAEYKIDQASQIQNNTSESLKLVEKATSLSPQIIDYGLVYMSQELKIIENETQLLSVLEKNSSTELNNKQKTIQDGIENIQKNIDKYRDKNPDDIRLIKLQLDLYTLVDKYDNVEEEKYLYHVKKGLELSPYYLYWNLYEAEYYVRKAQKNIESRQDGLDRATSLLEDILNNNNLFIPAYKTYYELLSLDRQYSRQIDLLINYVDAVNNQNLFGDKDLLYALGVAYQNNRQYTDSINVYQRLILSFPDYTKAYLKLGEIYQIQSQNDLALENYKKVLELDPNADSVKSKIDQLE
ncbi:MAG: hypothetical protein RLZZ223_121 [Candidatus Parcubacteria bacterium]